MIRTQDLYTAFSQEVVTTDKGSGVAFNRYEIRQLFDVRNLTVNRTYLVRCTQRIVLQNPTQPVPDPTTTPGLASFLYYPALVINTLTLSHPVDAGGVRLVDYSPRTINAAVSVTSSTDAEQAIVNTYEHTAGKSFSQTNNFGVSLAGGFFGNAPTGSLGGDYGYSGTSDRFTSDTVGRTQSQTLNLAESDNMTVKDWAAYSSVDPSGVDPTWMWGQEYPWDVIQFHMPNGPVDSASGWFPVDLPEWIRLRLFELDQKAGEAGCVYPPSQLSLFGVDFVMTALWQIELPPAVIDQYVQFEHSWTYFSGSHQSDSTTGNGVYLSNPTSTAYSSGKLDLTLFGLDAIQRMGGDNGAVVGFLDPAKFIVPPTATGDFQIVSDANNLEVRGAGFDPNMNAVFGASDSPSVQIFFKIVDLDDEYSLFLKHWVQSELSGCGLSISINGSTIPAGPSLTRHVDSVEGEGGDDNLMAIALRNRDYTSVSYHDYLVAGLNTLDIAITPDSASSGYVLRALAIQ
jgi:hypothetical protein